MPFGYWGAAADVSLKWPGGFLAYAWFLACALLLGGMVYAFRAQARALSRRQWAAVGLLALLGLLLSQSFPLRLPWSDAALSSQPLTAALLPFAAVPYLLAAAAFNPLAAILVGLATGLGRALGQTHAPVDILAVGLAAGLAGMLLQQNYAGRLFRLLRQPAAAGALAHSTLALFASVTLLTTLTPAAGFMAALDLAVRFGAASLLPLAIEGAFSGALVALVQWVTPRAQPAERGTVPSPLHRSLQAHIVANFASFALVVVCLSATVAFVSSARSTSRSMAEQMAYNVDTAALRLGALQRTLTNSLVQAGSDERLARGDRAERARVIGQVQRSTPQFRSVQLVTAEGIVGEGQADAAALDSLTPDEQRAVEAAQRTGQAQLVVTPVGGDSIVAPLAAVVSLAVPVERPGLGKAVLLGRVSESALTDIAADLQVAADSGRGLIVDATQQVITGSDAGRGLPTRWDAPRADQASLRLGGGRQVYELTDSQTGARELVYYATVADNGWKVVASVPQAVILRDALGVMGPVAGLLVALSIGFVLAIVAFGRSVTEPIAELARTAKAIATGGGLDRPVRSQRNDEIGQLTLAFSQMQRALRQRLDEQSLLLAVSNEVASTISLADGMAAILQGVLRGTGASGARAIVRNPNAPGHLVFTEGPGAQAMAGLDRHVVSRTREAEELALVSPQEITAALGMESPPVAALFAVPLRSASEPQGTLYVGYRQPHYFDSSERTLLRTLGGQAAVLVHNAQLFTAAESGRQRLAAILTSTTNAVIVTDQDDRVLLLNPAMEQAFGLRTHAALGRPVVEVLSSVDLARRMSMGMSAATRTPLDPDGKLDLEANGRTFLASISTVHNGEGQALGRVAVLQDVSDLKELDRMKSDFLAGVSHDLLSPLTYMQNYVNTMTLIDDEKLRGEYADKIVSGIDRVTRMVKDLLDAARIEAGVNLQIEHVAVPEMLVDISHEYASMARAQGIKLIVEGDVALPPVLGDPSLLRRAVTNLVTNALKYAAGSERVVLRAEQGDSEIVISVSDQGPGIPAEVQAHLFEKFYRGPDVTKQQRGSGLGLSIVKSVADHHGGRVWCASREGVGTTFYLALPFQPPPRA